MPMIFTPASFPTLDRRVDRTVVGAGYAVAWVFDNPWNYVTAQQIF
jgi:hypothetical protein